MGHFTLTQITEAKKDLWEQCGAKSEENPEKEAHVMDISAGCGSSVVVNLLVLSQKIIQRRRPMLWT